MPNHVENVLHISGPADRVDELFALIAGDSEFDFNKVIPYPERFASVDAEYRSLGHKDFVEKYGAGASNGYNSGGYEWCVANWGTKWNAYEIARRNYQGNRVTFQTAWSPPVPVVVALHKLCPEATLCLEYFERGMAIAGGFTCLSKEDHYEDDEGRPWEPGAISDEWKVDGYRGPRGG